MSATATAALPARPADAAQRVARFRLHREATIPPALAVRTEGADLARMLGLLFDAAEAVSPNTLRLSRFRLPGAVDLNTDTLAWRCLATGIEGRGVLELASWASDRDLLRMACIAYVVQWAAAQARRR
jgi:hypothetical protein